jgi:hypothetical protein
MHHGRECAGLVLLLAVVTLAAGPAHGESALLLEHPDALGVVAASTYDTRRERVGKAHLSLDTLDGGGVRMASDSGYTAGARTVVYADFAGVDGSGKVRPVVQESRSFDDQGNPLGVLRIDHQRGVASCAGPDGELMSELPLPANDRVVNVALNLFFLPLVRGETDELSFQLFLCGGGARLVDFVANLAPDSGKRGDSRHLVEVRYGPDFGIATLVARSFVPKLSFWFDPQPPHRWMAHRLPLYGKGPEVFVVRDGVPTRWLGDE